MMQDLLEAWQDEVSTRPLGTWRKGLKEKFRLYLPSGNLFAIDPISFQSDESRENILAETNGMDQSALRAYLCDRSIGLYEWGLAPSTYNFRLNSVLSQKRHGRLITNEAWRVHCESGLLLLADLDYFHGVIEHYDVACGLTKALRPHTRYEKTVSSLLGQEEELALCLVASTAYRVVYEFNGPGDYWIRNHTFAVARKKKKRN